MKKAPGNWDKEYKVIAPQFTQHTCNWVSNGTFPIVQRDCPRLQSSRQAMSIGLHSKERGPPARGPIKRWQTSPYQHSSSLLWAVISRSAMPHSATPWTAPHQAPLSMEFPWNLLEWVAILFSRGIFQAQRLNPALLLCRWILYHLSHQGSPGFSRWCLKRLYDKIIKKIQIKV